MTNFMKKLILSAALVIAFTAAGYAQITEVNSIGNITYQNDVSDSDYMRVIVRGSVIQKPSNFGANPQFRVFTTGSGDAAKFNYYFDLALNKKDETLKFNIKYITQDADGVELGSGVLKSEVDGKQSQFWFPESITGIFEARYIYIKMFSGSNSFIAKFDLGAENVVGEVYDFDQTKRVASSPFDKADSDNPFGNDAPVAITADNWVDQMGIEILNPFNLDGYLTMFIQDAKLNGIDLSYVMDGDILLEFDTPADAKVIAYTDRLGDDDEVHVVVNPRLWAAASPAKRLAIFFHELGHDILNFDHDAESGPLMSVYAQSDYTYAGLFELKTQMFNDYKAGVTYSHESE